MPSLVCEPEGMGEVVLSVNRALLYRASERNAQCRHEANLYVLSESVMYGLLGGTRALMQLKLGLLAKHPVLQVK